VGPATSSASPPGLCRNRGRARPGDRCHRRGPLPRGDIRTESFAETRLAPGAVDLVIGNVPFGKLTLHDPDHNAGRHSIHNHFIMKGLDLTRPGGLIAVVTSRFTLDAKADAARQAMAERADLVGAIRLPAGTFRAAAGTDVVCDILVLSKRPLVQRFEVSRGCRSPRS